MENIKNNFDVAEQSAQNQEDRQNDWKDYYKNLKEEQIKAQQEAATNSISNQQYLGFAGTYNHNYGTCPNCGYCRHCGRGRYWYDHRIPYYPEGPYWVSNTVTYS